MILKLKSKDYIQLKLKIMKINESRLVQCGFKFVNDKIRQELLNKIESKLSFLKVYDSVLEGYYQIESERYCKHFDAEIIDNVKLYKIKGNFGKHLWICCYNFHEFFIVEDIEELLNICDSIHHNENLGFVYIIESTLGFKIGKTKNFHNRLKQFEVKLPFDWNFHEIYSLERFNDMEKMAHELLEDKKINGEWFMLCETDFKLITQLYNQLNSPT